MAGVFDNDEKQVILRGVLSDEEVLLGRGDRWKGGMEEVGSSRGAEALRCAALSILKRQQRLTGG
jgi:hypothetical protein